MSAWNRRHLVPKQITDKNGVTTTRWVLPVAGSQSNSLSQAMIPTVTAGPAASVDHVKQTALIMADWLREPDDDDDLFRDRCDIIEEWLEGYPEETVSELSALCERRKSAVTPLFSLLSQEGSPAVVEVFADSFEVLKDSNSYSEDKISYALNGLSHYPELAQGKRSKNTPKERREKATAVALVTQALLHRIAEGYVDDPDDVPDCIEYKEGKNWSVGAVIADRDLLSLVLDRPRESQRISELIVERGVDVEMIRTILESPASAVAEGVL